MTKQTKRDSDSKHTSLRRRSSSNEHIFDPETRTLSIEKKKKEIRRSSNDEFVLDPHSDTYKVKEEQSYWDALKESSCCSVTGLFMLSVVALMINFYAHQNAVTIGRHLSCLFRCFESKEKKRIRDIDALQKFFPWRDIQDFRDGNDHIGVANRILDRWEIDVSFVQSHFSLTGTQLWEFGAKYHAFFSKFAFQFSLLFGPRDDPQTYINFKTFLDAEIYVIDLDNCLYDLGELSVDYWVANSQKEPCWNHEFGYLLDIGFFDGKKVYFFSACRQDLAKAMEERIKTKFGRSNFQFVYAQPMEHREARHPKQLYLIIPEDDRNKNIFVIDDDPFKWRHNFDMTKLSALYGQPQKDIDGIIVNEHWGVDKSRLFDPCSISDAIPREFIYPNAKFLNIIAFRTVQPDKTFRNQFGKRLLALAERDQRNKGLYSIKQLDKLRRITPS